MKSLLIVLAASLMLFAAFTVSAQDDLSTFPGKPKLTQKTTPVQMETCKQMVEEMRAERVRLDEMDSKIIQMVDVMDTATGDYKVTSMGSVVKELVNQRRTLRTMKQTMEGKMRGHMMAHSKKSAKNGKMECLAMTDPLGN